MISDQDFIDAGLPLKFLGKNWKWWRLGEVRQILSHYGKTCWEGDSRLRHMRLLNQVCEEHDFRSVHLAQFRLAIKLDYELPPPRPSIKDSEISTPLSASQKKPSSAVDHEDLETECSICLQDLPAKRFPKRITGACDHDSNVCFECLRASITTQFASNVWNQIECPTCQERLQYMDMKLFADSKVFERSYVIHFPKLNDSAYDP